MAALIATTRSSSTPSLSSSSENTSVHLTAPGTAERRAGPGVDLADRVEPVLDVVLGRLEAVALLGQAVHQHRTAELLGLPQGPLDGGLVVPVDRSDVLQSEVGEHALRRDHVLEPDLESVQQVVRGLARPPACGRRCAGSRSSNCSYRGLVRSPDRWRARPPTVGV